MVSGCSSSVRRVLVVADRAVQVGEARRRHRSVRPVLALHRWGKAHEMFQEKLVSPPARSLMLLLVEVVGGEGAGGGADPGIGQVRSAQR